MTARVVVPATTPAATVVLDAPAVVEVTPQAPDDPFVAAAPVTQAAPVGPATPPPAGPPVSRRPRPRLPVVLALAVLAGMVAAVLVAPGVGGDRPPDAPAAVATAPAPVGPAHAALTLVVPTSDAAGAPALALAVLAADGDGDATILLVPVGTVADVPGHGQFPLADAATFGGPGLAATTVHNLLGVRSDAVATASPATIGELASGLDGVPVDVRARVAEDLLDAAGAPILAAGVQALAGDRLAAYLTFRGDTETELESLPRLQQVLTGLVARVAAEPSQAQQVAAGLLAGDVEVAGDDLAATAGLLSRLAGAQVDDRLTVLTLPVAALGSGRDGLYRVDTERADTLLAGRLPSTRSADGRTWSLQVLNGNGSTGIGQQVAERLAGANYQVVLSGNADRFDHAVTRILLHGDDPEHLAAARDLQVRLGTGVVERSGTPQSVVDITVVVGRDFMP